MDKKVAEIIQMIKSEGYRITKTREIIIRLFLETDRHLIPEEVYEQIKGKGISLPTVYRTIDILLKMGIIKELAIHHDRYYELYLFSQKKMHIHFKCNRCGTIREYSDHQVFRDMVEQRDYIEKKYQDVIEDITIMMTGICQRCRKEMNESLVTPVNP
ncbi:Fur family transcriptional regulator [Anoxynatronum buryatiense]|uniref:Fe2+ or Zn2+ uptake regulation protein n=1 Tax=Anoxynatronum buryatiense TaxID=489973 RepID=A0AA45WTD0_9CLOT|nr:Fur family transcriptional regulator [Anoxynatronum buryatiense]SMP38678.1 Fe2+ or Zn2+ uptake regulation protein [Anoxynatronum buryatiense]